MKSDLEKVLAEVRKELASTRADFVTAAKERDALKADLAHFKTCPIMKCERCAVMMCPEDNPRHFNDTGCPACSAVECSSCGAIVGIETHAPECERKLHS